MKRTFKLPWRKAGLLISMIKWTRTSRLSIKISLSQVSAYGGSSSNLEDLKECECECESERESECVCVREREGESQRVGVRVRYKDPTDVVLACSPLT